MNPTTASTLAAYRDELVAAGFRYEHVEQLVTEAARELVANEGLTVKASELECGENKSGEPEGVLPKGILDVYQSLFDEQKKASDGVNRTISDAVQAVGELIAQLPGTPKLVSVADSFARLAHNMEQEAQAGARMDKDAMISVQSCVTNWRALPDREKTSRRRAAVVDHVVHSMAMEGEPVSRQWVANAKRQQAIALESR